MSDLIERQAATDALRKMQTYKLFSGDDMLLIDQAGAMTELMMLPSAEPKKGKWNFIGDNMFECSMCGVLYTTEQLNSLRNYDTDPYLPWFCPHCGADMRGEQNG